MNLATVIPNLGIEITEKKKTFTALLMVPILFLAVFMSACSFTDVLAEGTKILTYIPLAVNIALPLLCIDVAICPAAMAASKFIDASQASVLQLFQQWQAASAAAAPGILAQLQTAIKTLQENYLQLLAVCKVNDPVISAEVGAILQAIENSISQIANLTGAALKAGGTRAAAYTVKVKTLYTPKDFKSAVLAAVSKKTGDGVIDPVNAALQKQVRAW